MPLPLFFVQSYRSLFYKGDDNDSTGGGSAAQGGTPSAWLCPHSNRIALRVTSDQNNHIGADSTGTISSGSWNHVAFSFFNNTVNNEAFSATIFVNGVVDISMTFGEVDVVGNNGPLHIGRDLSNPGPRRAFNERSNWLCDSRLNVLLSPTKHGITVLYRVSTCTLALVGHILSTYLDLSRLKTTSAVFYHAPRHNVRHYE